MVDPVLGDGHRTGPSAASATVFGRRFRDRHHLSTRSEDEPPDGSLEELHRAARETAELGNPADVHDRDQGQPEDATELRGDQRAVEVEAMGVEDLWLQPASGVERGAHVAP